MTTGAGATAGAGAGTAGADGRSAVRNDRGLPAELQEVLHFAPDSVRLLRGLLADDRVPRAAKVEAGLVAAYLVSPVDVLPESLPLVGVLDDAVVLGLGLRRLVQAAGDDVVRDHWHGTERGLAVFRAVVDVMGRPGGLVRRGLAVARLGQAVRTPAGPRSRPAGAPSSWWRGSGSRTVPVVEGEVLSEEWHDTRGG